MEEVGPPDPVGMGFPFLGVCSCPAPTLPFLLNHHSVPRSQYLLDLSPFPGVAKVRAWRGLGACILAVMDSD